MAHGQLCTVTHQRLHTMILGSCLRLKTPQKDCVGLAKPMPALCSQGGVFAAASIAGQSPNVAPLGVMDPESPYCFLLNWTVGELSVSAFSTTLFLARFGLVPNVGTLGPPPNCMARVNFSRCESEPCTALSAVRQI